MKRKQFREKLEVYYFKRQEDQWLAELWKGRSSHSNGRKAEVNKQRYRSSFPCSRYK